MNVSCMTKDCNRDDCRVAFDQSSMSTCIGWMPTYDKRGRQIGSDPNVTTSGATCLTCGARWAFRTQGGKTTVTRTPPVAADAG